MSHKPTLEAVHIVEILEHSNPAIVGHFDVLLPDGTTSILSKEEIELYGVFVPSKAEVVEVVEEVAVVEEAPAKPSRKKK